MASALAVAALLLSSCGKESGMGDELEWGEVMIDGHKYRPAENLMMLWINNNTELWSTQPRAKLEILPVKGDTGGTFNVNLNGELLNGLKGKKVSLVDPASDGAKDLWIKVTYMPGGKADAWEYNFSYDAEGMYYTENGTKTSGSPFKSGYVKFAYVDGIISFELDGVLVNDKPVAVKIRGAKNVID